MLLTRLAPPSHCPDSCLPVLDAAYSVASGPTLGIFDAQPFESLPCAWFGLRRQASHATRRSSVFRTQPSLPCLFPLVDLLANQHNTCEAPPTPGKEFACAGRIFPSPRSTANTRYHQTLAFLSRQTFHARPTNSDTPITHSPPSANFGDLSHVLMPLLCLPRGAHVGPGQSRHPGRMRPLHMPEASGRELATVLKVEKIGTGNKALTHCRDTRRESDNDSSAHLHMALG